MVLHLHREENLSASRGNFKAIYWGKFDGIPSRSRNPIAKKLTVGCYFKGQIYPFLIANRCQINFWKFKVGSFAIQQDNYWGGSCQQLSLRSIPYIPFSTFKKRRIFRSCLELFLGFSLSDDRFIISSPCDEKPIF